MSDLSVTLSNRPAKSQVKSLASELVQSKAKVDALVKLIASEENPAAQHGAWVFQYCMDMSPEIIFPHLDKMIEVVKSTKSVAIRRSIIRAFAGIEIPDQLRGPIIDLCFSLLSSPKATVAVKVHSMQVLWNTCCEEPDLLDELELLINAQLPGATAGFQNRGSKILNKIHKTKSTRQS